MAKKIFVFIAVFLFATSAYAVDADKDALASRVERLEKEIVILQKIVTLQQNEIDGLKSRQH